jgi:lysophospholipase L1-like esterase
MAVAAAALVACGRPMTAPPSTYPANVVVFYDEDSNGIAGALENVRLPGVVVKATAGSVSTAATTAPGTGRAWLAVPEGASTLAVDESSLPPFFVAWPLGIGGPPAGDVYVAAALPIGDNRPDTYLGFGDSLTRDSGYLAELEYALAAYFGAAHAINGGTFGSHSGDGAYRIHDVLAAQRPAYTLILYGTNDWDEAPCRARLDCGTVENLRYMITAAKAAQSLPFLATIVPVNTGYDAGAPPERNVWVAEQNVQIRALARHEGAVLVDLEKAFLAEPSLGALFEDHIHPNARGRALIAREFLNGITKRKG